MVSYTIKDLRIFLKKYKSQVLSDLEDVELFLEDLEEHEKEFK